MEENKVVLNLIEGTFGVCKLREIDEVPEWAKNDKFVSVTRTNEELSIVCSEEDIPQDITAELHWKILKIEGILDFSLIGIIAKISSILTEKGISIFVISTFNTDYILIKDENINKSICALEEEGYIINK
jgi:hypothetical protein